MQKGKIPTNRAQRLDENNGVICLAIMFTPRFVVIPKMANFLYFLLMTEKL